MMVMLKPLLASQEKIQAVLGANPDIPFTIFKNVIDRIAADAVRVILGMKIRGE
jgi:hypothetical protein